MGFLKRWQNVSVESPHSVPSSKTISGTRMTLQVLKQIRREIEAVHWDYVSKVKVKALMTLLIEHFNSNKNSLLWKNPKASKPFLIENTAYESPVSRAVEKLRRVKGNNIFSF